jgi:hypothetical protein
MTNSAAAPGSIDSGNERPWLRLAELLLIFLVFFALAGDPAPHQNEPYYLCRLKHFWNPPWCAGDLFLDSPEAHLTFVWTFGWLTKWLSLSATAWAGRVFVWALLAWAWQRLSWRIVPKPFFAVLSSALWVVPVDQANLAGEWVVGGFESKCVAYVFVLLALHELANARWKRVWLLLGAASAFHVLVGGWSVVVCATICLVEREGRQSIRSMLPGLCAGGLLALFGIVPALRLTLHQTPEVVAEANRIYVFDRLPHHLSPLTVPQDEVIRRLTRHGLLLLTLGILVLVNRRLDRPSDSIDKLRSGGALRRLTLFAWGAALLAAVGLLLELILWNQPAWAAALLRYYWFRLTDVAVPMAVALNAVMLINSGFVRGRRWATWALIAAIAVAGLPLFKTVRDRADNPVPPSDSGAPSYDDWVDVCNWVTSNTPPKSLFITPRSNQSFKWRTGRPEVASRKDIPQDARSMVEWSNRLHNIYYHEVDGLQVAADSVADLGAEHVTAMAEKYGADYILAYRDPALKLPVEFANNTYVLYHIKH